MNKYLPRHRREIEMLLRRLAADAFELLALAAVLGTIAMLAHP